MRSKRKRNYGGKRAKQGRPARQYAAPPARHKARRHRGPKSRPKRPHLGPKFRVRPRELVAAASHGERVRSLDAAYRRSKAEYHRLGAQLHAAKGGDEQ